MLILSGGYTALVSKGMSKAEENLIKSIPKALACTEHVYAVQLMLVQQKQVLTWML